MAKLSKGVRILGWLAILRSLFGSAGFFIGSRIHPDLAALGEEGAKIGGALIAHNRAWTPFFMVSAIWGCIFGIALLKGRGWARAYLCYGTVIGIILFLITFLSNFTRWSQAFVGFLMLSWMAFVLYYLNRPAVKAQFTPVTSRIRLTVLFVALVLGCIGFVQAKRQTALVAQLTDVLVPHN